jgi:peptidyl-prolyl cis-trans isomerase D
MIQWMHTLSKSWVATLLMGALALSFVIWGIADVFTGASSTAVASIGGVDIDQQAFQRTYRNFIRNQSQQMGAEITPDMAQKMGLGQVALQQLVSRTALTNEAARLGLVTPDSAVVQNVHGMAPFRGPLGQFDRPTFVNAVQNAGYTEDQFLNEIREDLTRQQLTDAVEANFVIPPGYAQALFLFINERRAADYVLITPEAAGPTPAPGDGALNAYIKANAARFSTPEYRDADYAEIAPADVIGTITVTDAQIAQDYNAHKDIYVIAEKRDVQQIEFKTQAEAAVARAKIQSGTTFDALAASRGLKPAEISLGTLVQGDIPDGDRAKAIFALPLNDVSAPVKTGFGGWVLARVTKIAPGSTRTLADAKEDIRKSLLTQLAAAKLVDIVNAFQDARGSGGDLVEAAKKAGMHVGHLKAIDANGLSPDGSRHADAPADPEFLSALFKAEIGEDSDAFPTKAGSYYAIKVTGTTPPKLKSLDAVRADATASWSNEQRATLLAAKAGTLLAQAEKDKSLDGVAKALGVSVQHSPALNRQTNDTMFSSAIVQQLFTAAPGGIVYGPQGMSGNFLIARITGILHPHLDPRAPDFQAGSQRLSATVSGDFSIALANAARASQGVKVNQKLVQSTVGGNQ